MVVGKEEEANQTINLRIREEGDKIIGQKSIIEMKEMFHNLIKNKK